MQSDIKALVFDLDGTLYVNLPLGREILASAGRYIADLKGMAVVEAEFLIEETRSRLSAASGRATTLSEACELLGGNLQDLHGHFAVDIKPERFLTRNHRVVELVKALRQKFELYIYTNNNTTLTGAILGALGLTGLFRDIFTIEDFWQPKPDRETLAEIFQRIGRKPEECLFIGDRYDVDLRLPAEMGSAVFLVGGMEDLFPLGKLLEESL